MNYQELQARLTAEIDVFSELEPTDYKGNVSNQFKLIKSTLSELGMAAPKLSIKYDLAYNQLHTEGFLMLTAFEDGKQDQLYQLKLLVHMCKSLVGL